MFIMPFLCLAYLNTKLMSALKDIKKKRRALTNKHKKEKDDHVTMIVVVIVLTFIGCQTPALVNQIFWSTLPYPKCGSFHFYYTKISDILVILNSSANFVIYCLFGKTFRNVFIDTICLRYNKNSNGTHELLLKGNRKNSDKKAKTTDVTSV